MFYFNSFKKTLFVLWIGDNVENMCWISSKLFIGKPNNQFYVQVEQKSYFLSSPSGPLLVDIGWHSLLYTIAPGKVFLFFLLLVTQVFISNWFWEESSSNINVIRKNASSKNATRPLTPVCCQVHLKKFFKSQKS